LVVATDTLTTLDSTSTGATDAAQNFRAGNSEWAAFMTGGVLKGVRSATIPFASGNTVGTCTVLPLAGLGDIDETGRAYLIQNFSADNGLAGYSAGGARLWTVNTSVLDGSNRMRAKNGSVAYQDTTGAWHLAAATTGALQSFAPRIDTVAAMVPVLVGTIIYVVELTNTQLTIRPATASTGYVLATSANLFNPDALALTATTIRIGWSVSTGEAPTDIRVADLNITTGGTTLGTTASGALVFGSSTPGTVTPFTVGPVEGGDFFGSISLPQHQEVTNAQRIIDPIWLAALQQGMDAATGQIDAARIVPPIPTAPVPSFGTIDVTGQDPVAALVSGDVVQFIAGSGITITTDAGAQSVTFTDNGDLGLWYWSPLTDGDIPQTELIFANGDTIMVPQLRT
jgi:hypothetical protein